MALQVLCILGLAGLVLVTWVVLLLLQIRERIEALTQAVKEIALEET